MKIGFSIEKNKCKKIIWSLTLLYHLKLMLIAQLKDKKGNIICVYINCVSIRLFN